MVLCPAILGQRALLHWPPSERSRFTADLLQTARPDVLFTISRRYTLLLSQSTFDNRIHRDPGIVIHESNGKDVVANHNRKYKRLYSRLPKSILNDTSEICSFSIGAGGRPHRSSRRAPRGGNCWTENFQPCPASVLPITEAEVGVRPPLDAPSLFLPTRRHACRLRAPMHLYYPHH